MRATFAALAALAALGAFGALDAMASPAASAAQVAPASPAVGKGPETMYSKYVAELYKGTLGWELNESLGEFYIPDGQCSGVLDNLLNCKLIDAPSLVGVRVHVRDTMPFPLVALHDTLRRASVLRAQPCVGEALVSVKLACADFDLP